MKKILFLMNYFSLPVPSTMGGGVEELMTLLLNEHEKEENPEYKFYFVNKKLTGKEKKYNTEKKYKNSEIVNVKYNHVAIFLTRAINKIFRKLKIKKQFSNSYDRHALKTVKKLNPDLIIFEGSFECGDGRYAKTFDINKLALHIHYQYGDSSKFDLKNYFSSTISVSNFISEDWEKYMQNNYPNSKVNYLVLPNCINQDRFTKEISPDERTQIREKFNFKPDDFVIIFCGRIAKEKGVKELIEVVAGLPENIKLLIVGGVKSIKSETTPYMQKIVSLTEKYSEKVKFTGYIKNDELYKYYRSAELQIVPSLWEEAAGLVVVEGQACALPQIVTVSGGMPEFTAKDGCILVHKDERLKPELESAILKIYSSKAVQNEMKKANLQNYKKYTKEIYYKNFIELLGKIKM